MIGQKQRVCDLRPLLVSCSCSVYGGWGLYDGETSPYSFTKRGGALPAGIGPSKTDKYKEGDIKVLKSPNRRFCTVRFFGRLFTIQSHEVFGGGREFAKNNRKLESTIQLEDAYRHFDHTRVRNHPLRGGAPHRCSQFVSE